LNEIEHFSKVSPYVVVIIPLTHKAVFLILPSRKRKFLSDIPEAKNDYNLEIIKFIVYKGVL